MTKYLLQIKKKVKKFLPATHSFISTKQNNCDKFIS